MATSCISEVLGLAIIFWFQFWNTHPQPPETYSKETKVCSNSNSKLKVAWAWHSSAPACSCLFPFPFFDTAENYDNFPPQWLQARLCVVLCKKGMHDMLLTSWRKTLTLARRSWGRAVTTSGHLACKLCWVRRHYKNWKTSLGWAVPSSDQLKLKLDT